MSAIGDLVATLGMDAKPWHKSLDGAQSRLGSFNSGVQSSMGKMQGMFSKFGLGNLMGPLAGLAGGGMIAGFVKSTLDMAENMRVAQREATTLGMSLYGFLRFKEAAEESGRSINDVQSGMQKLMVNMAKAGEGDKGPARAFQEIGLKVQEIRGLSPEALMDQVAVAVSKIPDPIRRARIEMELLGKAGVNLDATLKKIAAGEKPPISEEQALVAASAGKNIYDFKKAMGDTAQDMKTRPILWFNYAVDPGFERKLQRMKEESHRAAGRQNRQAQFAAAIEPANQALDAMRDKVAKAQTPLEQFEQSLKGLSKHPGTVQRLTAEFQQLQTQLDTIAAEKMLDQTSRQLNAVGKTKGQQYLAQFYAAHPNADGESQRRAQSQAHYMDNTGAATERLVSLTQGWARDMGDVDERHRHVAQVVQALGDNPAVGVLGKRFREAMKAAEELDKQAFGKKLRADIKGLTEGPMDRLIQQAKDLREGFKQGLITREEYAAANDALKDQAQTGDSDKPKEMARALEYGTNEAWQQIIHQMYGLDKDKTDKQVAENTRKANELLKQIADNQGQAFVIP